MPCDVSHGRTACSPKAQPATLYEAGLIGSLALCIEKPSRFSVTSTQSSGRNRASEVLVGRVLSFTSVSQDGVSLTVISWLLGRFVSFECSGILELIFYSGEGWVINRRVRRGLQGNQLFYCERTRKIHLLPPSQRFCENHSSQMKWKHIDLLKEEHTYPPSPPPPPCCILRLRLTLKVFMLFTHLQFPLCAAPSLTAAFAHVSPSSQNALSPCQPSKLLFIPQDPSQASPSLCSHL